MQPNPVLRRLGLNDDDRAVIIHTDDIGMCLGSVDAFAELWDFGLISSGAVMVPCPWFLKAAAYARAHPQADLGVHSTLTSEWKMYRWGPISTRDAASGMIDEEGFFYHRSEDARAHGDPACVQVEIEAQVKRALQLGMQPTHLDTHMGTVGSLKFMREYLKTAIAYRLPPMIFRMSEADWRARKLDPQTAALAVQLMGGFEAMGLPLLDRIEGLELDQPENRLEQAMQVFASLKPGITHFIIHPSKDTAELRAITPDWRARVADYETFLSDRLRSAIRSLGIHVIGYRAIQQLMPDPAILSMLPI